MVTPFLRRPLRALVPLAVLSASAPSSGKSLLSALIGLLVGQQAVPWPADNAAELETPLTPTSPVESAPALFDTPHPPQVAAAPGDTAGRRVRGFPRWARGTGGCLARHGMGGFLTTARQVSGTDGEGRKWGVFLACWLDRLGPGRVRVCDVLASGGPCRDHA